MRKKSAKKGASPETTKHSTHTHLHPNTVTPKYSDTHTHTHRPVHLSLTSTNKEHLSTPAFDKHNILFEDTHPTPIFDTRGGHGKILWLIHCLRTLSKEECHRTQPIIISLIIILKIPDGQHAPMSFSFGPIIAGDPIRYTGFSINLTRNGYGWVL